MIKWSLSPKSYLSSRKTNNLVPVWVWRKCMNLALAAAPPLFRMKGQSLNNHKLEWKVTSSSRVLVLDQVSRPYMTRRKRSARWSPSTCSSKCEEHPSESSVEIFFYRLSSLKRWIKNDGSDNADVVAGQHRGGHHLRLHPALLPQDQDDQEDAGVVGNCRHRQDVRRRRRPVVRGDVVVVAAAESQHDSELSVNAARFQRPGRRCSAAGSAQPGKSRQRFLSRTFSSPEPVLPGAPNSIPRRRTEASGHSSPQLGRLRVHVRALRHSRSAGTKPRSFWFGNGNRRGQGQPSLCQGKPLNF